jgi:long-chain acyl-CoA synthetase
MASYPEERSVIVETVPALFLHAAKTFNKSDAFKHKKDGSYVDVSHEAILRTVHKVSLGLLTLNLTRGDRIALLSENRIEWAIADLAILSAGCINVPIYATLPQHQVEYILRDCEARAILVSGDEQLAKIESIRQNLPNLSHVIIFSTQGNSGEVITLDALVGLGEPHVDAQPYDEMTDKIGKYDWASIIYTSGTTGDPKGAILSHENFLSNVIACSSVIDTGPEDCCLSFLPLSHVFERTNGFYSMLHTGVTIAYAEGMDTVPENLVEVSPTLLMSVPRLYEKMYARIMDKATSGSSLKKNLFFWALQVGKAYAMEKLEHRIRGATKQKYILADLIVFRKLRARTGGRLRFFISGGAPLAREISEFFFAAGLPILEGYGLTETSPVISVNTFEGFKFGTVGKPVPGVEVRIAADGEILVKGRNVMVGYYKKPKLTDEVIEDGWFHTGDIGFLDSDGFLSITDRKKDIIITAAGKNVTPQPIENLLTSSKYIAQAVLIGNRRRFISAIVVPNFDSLKKFCGAAGITYSNEEELVQMPKVIAKIYAEIERKSEHLAGFERVKKIILLARDFSLEENELTPTLKVKRSTIEKKFQKEIDALYE